jgi:uncharacterized protein
MPDKDRQDLDAPPDPGPESWSAWQLRMHQKYADPVWAMENLYKMIAPAHTPDLAPSPKPNVDSSFRYPMAGRESDNVISDQDIPVRSLWQHGGPVAGPKRAHLVLHSASGPHIISAVVAATQMEQHQGLMGVRHLGDNEGMLFPHQTPRPVQMWMKNTLIPLDMVFIRGDGVVTKIVSARPLSLAGISSGGPVGAVLEVAGGLARRIGLRIGDKVSVA